MRLEIQNMTFGYDHTLLFQDLSLTLDGPRLVFLIGANGAGKSTLLKLILGQLTPQEGHILLDGEDVQVLGPKALAAKVSYLPQNHRYSYDFTVENMVLMGLSRELGFFERPGKRAHEKVDRVLHDLGLDAFKRRTFASLSGGERQLVLLARALVQDAPLILMDEVTANLDLGHRRDVIGRARQLVTDGYTVIMATHQLDWALETADDLLLVNETTRLLSPTDPGLVAILEHTYDCSLETAVTPSGQTIIVPRGLPQR